MLETAQKTQKQLVNALHGDTSYSSAIAQCAALMEELDASGLVDAQPIADVFSMAMCESEDGDTILGELELAVSHLIKTFTIAV